MRHTQGLQRAARQEARRWATVYRGRKRSYGEVLDRVGRFAAGLRGMGAQPGDRIALIAMNSDRYYEAYYAILWAGCIAVPGNTRWAPAEHAYALRDSEPKLLLVDRTFAALGAQLAADFALPVILLDDSAPGDDLPSEDQLIEANPPMADAGGGGTDLVGIFYTGGTTGWPKGVMLTHASMIANFQSSALVRPYPSPCIFLHSPPMFHLADATVVFGLTPLAPTHVIVPGFDPAGVVAAIQQERVNALVLVPTMLNMMDLHLREHPADLSGVESVTYGASAISEAALKRAMQNFPRARFAQAYGQTELSPVATVLEPRFHSEEGAAAGLLRSAGRAIPNVELRIVDDAMNEVALGEVGEVVVRSAGAMLGYWKKPDLTAQTIVDGWLRTGDAGYLDEAGFLFLVDRVKDMIVSGGENVYSAEVENALYQHPAVAECAVIGVPDPKWGERVHAIVRLRAGTEADDADFTRHCEALIAGYKRPRSYEFRVEPLPLSGAGKILKTELRRPHWPSGERHIN
ncbi:Long-chain-fatty-acid--CoA ligase [Alphaproteobacteria bacterium SO-S41]|nr:Long-chain-fatty-acid--CoA ligase [Alphaproteobacteria bacterium SO-S41]